MQEEEADVDGWAALLRQDCGHINDDRDVQA